jgi:hypothetical protein
MYDNPVLGNGAEENSPRATEELVSLINGYFDAKTRVDIDAMMEYFSRDNTAYYDATMGWMFSGWEKTRDVAKELFPSWGEGAKSYATKIIGDTEGGAIVFMLDSEEMFGAEIRSISTVDFDRGKITRVVDYWSGLRWTERRLAQMRVPAEAFPADLGEAAVPERAHPAMRRTATELAEAFATGDADAAVKLLAPDAEFDDLAANIHLLGQRAIHSFLQSALPLLPYGKGVRVRHVVGSAQGGGFEWTAGGMTDGGTDFTGLRGVTALELDDQGRIARLTSAWDGAVAGREALVAIYRQTLTAFQ